MADPLKIYVMWYVVQVLLGDVIYIEANSGAVKRVGRSDAYSTEYDLEAEEYVPLPKGDVHKKKEIVQLVNKINPIIEEYMNANSIDIILSKQGVYISKTNHDITKNILDIVNKKIN